MPKYQLFDSLRDEEYAALKADIANRGVLIPVEKDADGNILDGHHRASIADELGITYPTKVRRFKTEQEKREHVIKINMARRHLSPLEWGLAFKRLLAERGVKRGKGKTNQHTAKATIAQAAAELGVPERTAKHRVKLADDFESLPAAERKAVANREKTVTQAKREQKEQTREQRRQSNRKLVESAKDDPPPVQAKFSTIVIDPPWDWGDEGDVDQLGRAKPTYATMGIDEIAAYQPSGDGRLVGDFADEDCHLYLWITNRSLPKGFRLLDAWGFRYITCLTWCKPSFGMGNYFRGQTEHVLFGVKGSQSLKRKDVGTCFRWPRGPHGHSSKPTEFYGLVESCSPGPYLELFARSRRTGWACIGAEA